MGDFDGEGVEVAAPDLGGTEFLGGDSQDACAAPEIRESPVSTVGGPLVGQIGEETKYGGRRCVMASTEGEIGRGGNDLPTWELRLNLLEVRFRGGGGDDQPVADLERGKGSRGDGGPILILEGADAAAKNLLNLPGSTLSLAIDLDTDGRFSRDGGDDKGSVRKTAEALFPSVRPFGGGEFGPDVHFVLIECWWSLNGKAISREGEWSG